MNFKSWGKQGQYSRSRSAAAVLVLGCSGTIKFAKGRTVGSHNGTKILYFTVVRSAGLLNSDRKVDQILVPDRQTDRQTDGRTDGQTQTDGRTDGQTDRRSISWSFPVQKLCSEYS